MKTTAIISLTAIMASLFFFSKSKPKNDVYFKVINSTNQNFKVNLGELIKKNGSYFSKSFKTKIRVGPNETSSYKQTFGSFLGYSKLEIYLDKHRRLKLSRSLESHFTPFYSNSKDKINHPYKDEYLEGKILEDGYYSITILNQESENIKLEVSKSDR